MKHYDIIIAGAGCAGLSLAVKLAQAGYTKKHRIAVVDKEQKNANDRTWCFWERGVGTFEPVVSMRWSQLYFHGPRNSIKLQLAPYAYKMIRGADFYRYSLGALKDADVAFLQGDVGRVGEDEAGAWIEINNVKHTASYVFDSVHADIEPKQKGKHYLLQHFLGWRIKTEQACFDPSAATFMDFRVSQAFGHCFIYILPFADNEALVECTFFSEALAPQELYEQLLKKYIHDYLNDTAYKILETEVGVIPMTNHAFPPSTKRIVYMGTAGGFTKPTSGYTFKFIQEHTDRLASALVETGTPTLSAGTPKRFRFYDSVMLHVLQRGAVSAEDIFEPFFRKNPTPDVFDFLNNDSNLAQELSIISTLPKMPFVQAAWQEIGKRLSLKT